MSTHTLINASAAIHARIRDYIDGLLDDGCIWRTPYGTFARNAEDVGNKPWLNTDYKILLTRVDNHVLFAIVPDHIQETDTYDGFACSYGDINTVPNVIQDKYPCPVYMFNGVIDNAAIVMYIV